MRMSVLYGLLASVLSAAFVAFPEPVKTLGPELSAVWLIVAVLLFAKAIFQMVQEDREDREDRDRRP